MLEGTEQSQMLTQNLGGVVHVNHLSTWEAEVEGCEFEASLEYVWTPWIA